MPIYDIHKHELPFYQERQRKGELLMHGMTVTPNGYRLNLTMTPRVADAMKHPPLPPVQPVKVPPSEPQKQEMASVAMVKCFDCGVEHPANEDCAICAPIARAALLARERRRAWHLFKRGEGPRPL